MQEKKKKMHFPHQTYWYNDTELSNISKNQHFLTNQI